MIRPVLILGLAVEGAAALLLAHVPTDANYFANVLPGFLGLGFGLGLAFVAVPLLVMADVSDEDTGMASGMMQTAHEIGISLGVAVLSAVGRSSSPSASPRQECTVGGRACPSATPTPSQAALGTCTNLALSYQLASGVPGDARASGASAGGMSEKHRQLSPGRATRPWR